MEANELGPIVLIVRPMSPHSDRVNEIIKNLLHIEPIQIST